MVSEYQALTLHFKKGRRENHHHQGKHSHQKNNVVRRDSSRLRCYTCDEIGHFSRNCPKNKNGSKNKKNSKRRRHAHTVEDDDPLRKRVKQESEDSSSEDEYVLISALMGTVTHGSKDWLIDSEDSKHMISFKESFEKLFEHNSPHKVKLMDDYQYPIKGKGESSYKLDSEKSMKMKDVLFVPGLKKNLLSILALDANGMGGCISRFPIPHVVKRKDY